MPGCTPLSPRVGSALPCCCFPALGQMRVLAVAGLIPPSLAPAAPYLSRARMSSAVHMAGAVMSEQHGPHKPVMAGVIVGLAKCAGFCGMC
jgi:hypothetical protein